MTDSLEDDILVTYKRACIERELDIAEILLQALELTAHRKGDDERLNQALLFIVDSMPAPRSR